MTPHYEIYIFLLKRAYHYYYTDKVIEKYFSGNGKYLLDTNLISSAERDLLYTVAMSHNSIHQALARLQWLEAWGKLEPGMPRFLKHLVTGTSSLMPGTIYRKVQHVSRRKQFSVLPHEIVAYSLHNFSA